MATEQQDNDAVRRQQVLRKLYTASILCLLFMVVEVTGGYFAKSLAIMSDAAHLFADLAAFLVSIGAAHLASLPSTNRHTFGIKRVESLAALFSMVSLALVCVFLAVQAVIRMYQFYIGTMEEVDGKIMSLIAFIGVLVNVALAFVLGGAHPELPGGGHGHDHDHDHGGHDDHGHDEEHDSKGTGGHDHNGHDHSGHDHGGHDHGKSHDHQHTDEEQPATESTPLTSTAVHNDEVLPATATKKERNVNLEAAYLHVLGDLLQSFAVLVAGLIIWLVPSPNIRIIDPIATFVFCILVFYSTLNVIRTSIAVILEEVPPEVSWDQVYQDIAQVDGVSNVHDLHIWSISHGVPALSVHCNAKDPEQALKQILDICIKKYEINHSTVQVERGTDEKCMNEGSGGKKHNECF